MSLTEMDLVPAAYSCNSESRWFILVWEWLSNGLVAFLLQLIVIFFSPFSPNRRISSAAYARWVSGIYVIYCVTYIITHRDPFFIICLSTSLSICLSSHVHELAYWHCDIRWPLQGVRCSTSTSFPAGVVWHHTVKVKTTKWLYWWLLKVANPRNMYMK